MSRAKVTLRDLAREAKLDTETAALLLLDAGLDIEHPSDHIPRSRLSFARSTMGLGGQRDARTLAELSKRAGIPTEVVRKKLRQGGIPLKSSQTKIPRNAWRHVESILGLRLQVTPFEQAGPIEAIEAKKALKAAKSREKRKAGPGTAIWPTVGRVEHEMTYLSAKDVEDIHWIMVKEFQKSKDPIDPPGVRDHGLLESALTRPHTSLGMNLKYPTIPMAAAALLHAVVHNHAFYNGNKRTGLVALIVFLDKNGWILTVEQDELYDFVLALAEHTLYDSATDGDSLADSEVLYVSRWIRGHSRTVQKGEFPLRFNQLRQILMAQGCTIEPSRDGNYVDIRRGKWRTQIRFRNEGREVSIGSVHRIRTDLRLTEAHGCDSDIFYNGSERIPDFINRNRRVLERLAKV